MSLQNSPVNIYSSTYPSLSAKIDTVFTNQNPNPDGRDPNPSMPSPGIPSSSARKRKRLQASKKSETQAAVESIIEKQISASDSGDDDYDDLNNLELSATSTLPEVKDGANTSKDSQQSNGQSGSQGSKQRRLQVVTVCGEADSDCLRKNSRINKGLIKNEH